MTNQNNKYCPRKQFNQNRFHCILMVLFFFSPVILYYVKLCCWHIGWVDSINTNENTKKRNSFPNKKKSYVNNTFNRLALNELNVTWHLADQMQCEFFFSLILYSDKHTNCKEFYIKNLFTWWEKNKFSQYKR